MTYLAVSLCLFIGERISMDYCVVVLSDLCSIQPSGNGLLSIDQSL